MLDFRRAIGCLMALGFGACAPQGDERAPSADYVSAFYTGVYALEVGAFDRAASSLERAIAMRPDEPGAWANRGVLRLRRGDYDGAAKDLETARSLMPENRDIAMLQGLVERARGEQDAAIAFFRQAARHGLVKARYALMKEVERRGETGREEAWAQLGALIQQVPHNPALWVERARQASKRGDEEALRTSMEKLGAWAEGWPDAARAHLKLEMTPLRAVFLHNVLLRVPMYRQALNALIVPAERLGDPVFEFLTLNAPSAMASPPDLATHFAREPIAGLGGGDWSVLAPFWSEDRVDALAARASQVRGTDGMSLPFPGLPAANGMLAVDWNNDFALDLALAGAEGFRLFRRSEEGGVEDVTSSIGVGADVTAMPYTGAWGADVEMDGDVDLVLGRSAGPPLVLRNNGDGSFAAREPFGNVDGLTGFVWADSDGDGDPDAAMLDRHGHLIEVVNERAGVFTLGAQNAVNGVALAAGDLDRDGHLERVVLDRKGAVVAVSQGEIRHLVQGDSPVEPAALLIADLDNNGAGDVVCGKRAYLASETAFHVLDVKGRVSGVADRTGDGRLDLLSVSDVGEALQLVNRGDLSYRWQAIRPLGGNAMGDARINALGLGAEVELRSGSLYQKQVATAPVLHFGLGTYTGADVVRIVWPNGMPQVEFDLKANQVVRAVQRLKGSCPWVFAHNGSKMAFVTDFLWRSPLGMRINAQVVAGTAQTEDWVKITGDQLGTHDGGYDIRVTAELWETHFFDWVSLTAVDHPLGTAVFVDERFARVAPRLAVRATTQPRSFAVVTDDRGRDVSNRVRVRDGQYADTFGRGAYQGLTREHYVEVAVGDEAPREGRLYLIAQGWIRPTDSSINVAIGQGEHPRPRGLSLHVFDGAHWRLAHPDLGFPAGKRKTVLIDLSGVFPRDVPRKFRLQTNLEIYWDRLAWAVPLKDSVMGVQSVPLERASLRYRGFSQVATADASSPEVPDYHALGGTSQLWRDLIGYYTRYGDVKPLLSQVDDRYVIANAGDEIQLRFAALPTPKAGQVRDFVLKGDGWVKDGDYNTAFSTTVLPLPAHGVLTYDRPPKALEDDPVFQRHREDWQRFHTRYVTPEWFHRALSRPFHTCGTALSNRQQGDPILGNLTPAHLVEKAGMGRGLSWRRQSRP